MINYGMIVKNDNNKIMIQGDRLLQVWSNTIIDFTQSSVKPLLVSLFIPTNIMTINNMHLKVMVNDRFTYYSTGMVQQTYNLTNVSASHQHTVSIGWSSTATGMDTSGIPYVNWDKNLDDAKHEFDDYTASSGKAQEVTSGHYHKSSTTVGKAALHSHSVSPHTHSIVPNIHSVDTSASAISSLNFKITHLITNNNIIKTFTKQSTIKFEYNHSDLNNFLNQYQSGWYQFAIYPSNTTTKKLIVNYTIEALVGAY